MPQKIEISHRTIIFTVFFIISLWFLYQIRSIILALFVSLILMAALNPIVDKMERFKIPRALAIIFIYLVILGVIGGVLTAIIPPLISQTTTLISRFPVYIRQLEIIKIDEEFLRSQLGQLGQIPANIIKLSIGIFRNLLAVFVFLIVSFYLLLERKNLDKYLSITFGGADKKAGKIVDKIEHQLGRWVRAQTFLMTIIGVLTYIGLRLLGIEFALPLAILAGILEIIPTIGPFLSAVPAVVVGLAVSPLTGIAVAALYFLIQQLENILIVPKVMQKTVGINPLVTIFSLAVGFQLAGVMGALLAIPTVLLIKIFASEGFKEFYKQI
jgi:predicted PurR-regulated permease PerM